MDGEEAQASAEPSQQGFEHDGQEPLADDADEGPASEPPSPSKLDDDGLRAIDDVDPGIQHAEEASNTVGATEQAEEVITSYTEADEGVEADDGGGVTHDDAGSAEQHDTMLGANAGQQQAGEDLQTADVGAEASDPSSTHFSGAAPSPEPGERPASASSQPHAPASTSRPTSARPTSARPTSARPTSARPPSARPHSGSSARGLPGVDASEQAGGPGADDGATQAADAQEFADPAAAAAAAAALEYGAGARPGTSQSSGRPGSRPGSQQEGGTVAAAALPAPGPRRASAREVPGVPATIPEEHSAQQLALPPAQIDHYIATGYKAIDVEVEQGPGMPHRMIRVLIDYTQSERKLYLGGFRNKRTDAVYHHAATQTPRAPKYSEADRKLSRETQTVKTKQRRAQTFREQATQMERPGLLQDNSNDRVMTPGRYQTADERDQIVLRAVRCIQRWARGWLGRKRASYLKGKKSEREAFLRQQEQKAQQEAEENRRREIQRRMHPRTAADFEVLYNELEAWRLQETRKIKEAGLPKEQEQAVLQQLLHKETKLLQTIDRLKINANHENKELRVQHTLNAMSKPKKYELQNGGKVDVHTPFTTRAKELQQLYNGLNLPLLTIDERLDVLLHVKWTVKEFDCDLTREVVELIDREADLLNRGRSPKMLEGLRKRISSLFLNFIETPEFNPEAVRFQIVPMDFETYLYQNVGKAQAKAQTMPRVTAVAY